MRQLGIRSSYQDDLAQRPSAAESFRSRPCLNWKYNHKSCPLQTSRSGYRNFDLRYSRSSFRNQVLNNVLMSVRRSQMVSRSSCKQKLNLFNPCRLRHRAAGRTSEYFVSIVLFHKCLLFAGVCRLTLPVNAVEDIGSVRCPHDDFNDIIVSMSTRRRTFPSRWKKPTQQQVR